MDKVRAYKTPSKDLDSALLHIQGKGHEVRNILPCPEAMDINSRSPNSDATDVNIEMRFMIIYVEKEGEVL